MIAKTLEIFRRVECANCPHYRPRTDVCGYLVRHTAKKGRLTHPAGIANPRARCPNPKDRRWDSIPSFHAWYLFVWHIHLTEHELHYFTKFGIGWVKPLGTVELVYQKFCEQVATSDNLGLPRPPLPEKRSVLLAEFTRLSKTPNDYRHCDPDTYDIIDEEPERL